MSGEKGSGSMEVAKLASFLADRLWVNQFDDDCPKPSDGRFLALVTLCSQALQGSSRPEVIKEKCERLFGN